VIRGPRRVPLCPYTTLFRSWGPLRAAHQALCAARDAKGRQLEVVTLPMPAPLVYDGQRLPASYANFYIANGRVLVPTFNDVNDRDRKSTRLNSSHVKISYAV